MSTNNHNSAAATGFGLVAAGLAFMAIFMFALAAFITFCLTLWCLFAWNRPRYIGKHRLTPHEARAFVYRGLAGMLILPAFIVFCQALLGFTFDWNDYLGIVLIAGYVGGSLGILVLLGDEKETRHAAPAPPCLSAARSAAAFAARASSAAAFPLCELGR